MVGGWVGEEGKKGSYLFRLSLDGMHRSWKLLGVGICEG